MTQRICVVGAGIIGLTSAICIQESIPEAEVTIIADIFSPNTTSDGSAGFWLPFLVKEDQVQQINDWAKTTYGYLKDIATSALSSSLGIILVSGYVFSVKDPPWKDYVIGYKVLSEEEMKMFPHKRDGVFFTSVVVNVPKYLDFLMKRFKSKGGIVLNRRIESFEHVKSYDVIVNCTGLGSRQLMNDESVTPTRGQVARVRAPWIKHFYFDLDPSGTDFTYILNCDDVIVLGGTAQKDNWNTNVDFVDKEGILRRCKDLVPSLEGAKIVKEWAGLRPTRPSVKVEIDSSGNNKLIHNYGHGGAGVTICWGCALETTKLVHQQLISIQKSKL